MNKKNILTENKKSLNDLKKESIDGTNVLGGGVNLGNYSSLSVEGGDIRLEGNGCGTKNSASQTSAKPELL